MGVKRFQPVEPQSAAANEENYHPRYLRISWYDNTQQIRAGEHWRLKVRLKPPHGFRNTGGFDYEMWLYQQGIHATGYVRKDASNQRLALADPCSLGGIRQQLADRILQLETLEFGGLIAALAVGYKDAIQPEHWRLLMRTGTNHLMAISGLHIGLVAAMGFWLVRWLLPVSIIQRVPANQLAACVSLLLAFAYALLAGFAIPTQRAMLMLMVVLGAVLFRRHIRPLNGLSLALIVVLLIDPVAVLSAGFWFSFLAVGVLAYSFSGRLSRPGRLWQWGRVQWVIALALFPVSLFMFQQASLVAPLVNVVLVPWVSFLIVPLVLLVLCVIWPFPVLADGLLTLADFLLSLAWPLVNYLGVSPLSSWQQASPPLIYLLLAMVGMALLLAPKGFPQRWSGLLMLLPALLNEPAKPAPGDFWMSLLDVGQGLAVFIQTHDHSLVFDTGAKFSDRFNAGDRVLVPYLKNRGISSLDTLLVSHGDNDHVGGAASLIQQVPVRQLLGQDIDSLDHDNKQACRQGQHWQWDGVDFQILHPDRPYKQRNNRGCVLLVSSGTGRLLLAADIERKVESRLVKEYGRQLKSDVLVVPHHGSETSSSSAWIRTVNPDYALVSVGYKNRFNHPRPAIVNAYENIDAQLLSTADLGAINIKFSRTTGISVSSVRQQQQHYWNHLP
ncbi:MAG: DNA internalization-related competence protein ComEC/Rec2 [Gammaproteobacteria bacterium]|nr:DNA internalization-related competence protein ComEC/Rec2 [Gammaproteobacteria bacterium]